MLSVVGLCKSYTATLQLVDQLGDKSVLRACNEASDGQVFGGFDNINLSSSDSIEQRPGAPAKVQSGTFPVIYRLRNPNPNAMRLAPLLSRARLSPGLDFYHDIQPTDMQNSAACHQFRCYVLNVLATYAPDFKTVTRHTAFHYQPRRPFPPGYKTKVFPLQITSIDESTIKGNIKVVDNMYRTQLQLSFDYLLNTALLTINDQLTQKNLRAARLLRIGDVDSFTRMECFQLGIGLFHLCLNMVWALLHTHRGSLGQHGSLTHWFAVMEKTRLGGKHPDYYTLLAALLQILDGLLLDCWRIESGFPDLSSFFTSKPSSDDLVLLADRILNDHATPLPEPSPSKPTYLRPSKDVIHQNTRLLIHDLLYVAEVTRAISDGDFGRVEDILPNLAMMFRGAGGKNYCTEILHFMHNMKKVWKGDGFEYVKPSLSYYFLTIISVILFGTT